MKPATIIGIIVVIIIAIVIGLIAYSYSQIQISLQDMSFSGFDWNLSGISILKAGFDILTGNLLGTILSVITGIKLNLIFGLSNHGFFPVYIPDIAYDLSVNEIKVGQGKSNVDLTINPGETKQLPVLQDFQFSTIEPAASSVIASNGIMNIKVSGTAFFKFLGISVPVPFETTKQVSVVEEVNKYIKEKLSGQTSNYQSSLTATSISLQTSGYNVVKGQTVTFSGQLTDSTGEGIQNALIYVKRDIALLPDTVLGSAYTDSFGRFSVNWIATEPVTSNTAQVYASFDGSSQFSSSRSSDVSIQVTSYQTPNTGPQTTQSSSILVIKFPIANSQYQVGPSTYTYISFKMPCSGTATGSFSASAALGDNIVVYVLDQSGFAQFQAGRSASTYYNSGKVATGSFNIGLSSGQYYLILSNTYSTISTKNVNLQAYYICS